MIEEEEEECLRAASVSLSLWSRELQILQAMLHIDLCGHALLTAKVWVSFFLAS